MNCGWDWQTIVDRNVIGWTARCPQIRITDMRCFVPGAVPGAFAVPDIAIDDGRADRFSEWFLAAWHRCLGSAGF